MGVRSCDFLGAAALAHVVLSLSAFPKVISVQDCSLEAFGQPHPLHQLMIWNILHRMVPESRDGRCMTMICFQCEPKHVKANARPLAALPMSPWMNLHLASFADPNGSAAAQPAHLHMSQELQQSSC